MAIDQRLSESPIEAAMLRALHACWFRLGSHTAEVCQQYEISTSLRNYRVDFAIFTRVEDAVISVAIEVDGHEFHQRTKQQVERDYRRDRDLHRMGWIVLRFSGTEIHRNAIACALEAVDTIKLWADRLRKREQSTGDV